MATHIGNININVDTTQVRNASTALAALGTQATATQRLLNSLSTVNLSPATTAANNLATQITSVGTAASTAATQLTALGQAGGTVGTSTASGIGAANSATKQLDGSIGGAIASFQSLAISGLAVTGIASAVGSLAVSLYDANNRVQGMMLSFRALGSDGGSSLLAYQDAANSVGASFWESGKAIQSWNASTNGTSLEGQKAIEVFNTMSGAVQLFGGGADEVAGSMRALGQMMNKQQVYSEELVSQLGERFPAALKLASEATGLTVKQLKDALKEGKVASDGFINSFVDKVDEQYGPAMGRMANTTRGKVNEMKNSWNTLVSAISITVDNVLAELSRIPGTEDLLASSKRVILKQSLELNAAFNGNTKDEQIGRTYDDLTNSGFKITPAMQAEAQRLANERQSKTPARVVAQAAGGTLAVLGATAATGGFGILGSGATFTAGAYAGGKAMDGLSGLTTKNAPVTKEDLLMAVGTGIGTVAKEQRAIYQNSMNRSADFKGHADAEKSKKATDEANHQASVNETAKKNRLADAYTIADPKARNAAVNAIKAESLHKSANMNGTLALTGLGTELGRELAKTFDVRKSDQFFKSPKFAQLPQETQDTLRGFAADYRVDKNKTLAPAGGGKGKGLTPAERQDKAATNVDIQIDNMFNKWTLGLTKIEQGAVAAAMQEIDMASQRKTEEIDSALKFKAITKARHDEAITQLQKETAIAKEAAKSRLEAEEAAKAAKIEREAQLKIEQNVLKIYQQQRDEITKAAKENAKRNADLNKLVNNTNRGIGRDLINANPMANKDALKREDYINKATDPLTNQLDGLQSKMEQLNEVMGREDGITQGMMEDYNNLTDTIERTKLAISDMANTSGAAFDKMQADSKSLPLAMTGAANAYIQSVDVAKLSTSLAANTVTEFGSTLSEALGSKEGWKNREQGIKNYFASMLKQISNMVIQLGVVKPLMESVFGGASGTPSKGASGWLSVISSIGGSLTGEGGGFGAMQPVPHAVGGVFGGGHGIYSQPTLFNDSNGRLGVLGEGGQSEGILPLKRGKDGKLGVISSGGGGGSQINNFTPTIVIQGNADDETIAKMQASLRAEFKQHVAQSISKNNVKSQRPGGTNYK